MSVKSGAWVETRGNRFAGRYRDPQGRKRTVGSFATREQALEAAQKRLVLGTIGDYLDMTLTEYVEHWRDSHLGEERVTRGGKYNHYLTLNRYVLPSYGKRRIRDFEANPWLGHQIVTGVLSHPDARKTSQRRVRMALGSIFRPLVKMQLLRINPMSGVECTRTPKKKSPLFSVEDFLAIEEAMPSPAQKACLRFMLNSAMRPGEVFALRVSDIRFTPKGLAVIQQKRKIVKGIRPDESYVIEMDGSKTGQGHVVKLSARQAASLRAHIEREGLSGDDLVFPDRLVYSEEPRKRMDVSYFDPQADYGPYQNGTLRSRHGTATAYTYGCRCQYCRAAMVIIRRRGREKAATKRKPVKKAMADDYMTSQRWYTVFKRAVRASGIEWDGKAYTTRAAAATWMFKAGAELPDVQEALNHRNPATTLIYLRAAKAEEETTVNSRLDDVI